MSNLINLLEKFGVVRWRFGRDVLHPHERMTVGVSPRQRQFPKYEVFCPSGVSCD
jgi:hypothetical protein